MNWGSLTDRLREYPANYHHFLAPCPHDRIASAERQLGTVPAILKKMLQHFNGAELFIAAAPLLTLFGMTAAPPLSSLEWGEDWYIDKFTPAWRASGPDRDNDWAIGMKNYGGLILFNESQGISEWDTSERRWLLDKILFGDWIEEILAEGETMMAELNLDKGLR
jgi:hypothetical protein